MNRAPSYTQNQTPSLMIRWMIRGRGMDRKAEDTQDSEEPFVAGGDYKSQHALCPGHLACWEV